MPATEDRLRAAADNVLLLLISRLAMASTPLVASILVYVGGLYLEARFSATTNQLTSLETRVDTLTKGYVDLNARVGLINQATTNNTVAWNTTSLRLDKLTDSIQLLSNNVAALDATVKAMR